MGLKEKSGSHRERQVESTVIPLCVPLIQAIGHRMAYDAAIEASVDPALIDIYFASAILSDPAWYSETKDPAVHLPRSRQLEMQLDACTRGVGRLEEWLDKLGVEPYVLAPIVSDEKWDAYEQMLDAFEPSDGAYVEEPHIQAGMEGTRPTTHSTRIPQSGSTTAKL